MARLIHGLRTIDFESLRQVGEYEMARLRSENPDLDALDPREADYIEWLQNQSVESVLTGAFQDSGDRAEFLAAMLIDTAPFDVSDSAAARLLAEVQQATARVFGSGEFIEYLKASSSDDPAAEAAWAAAHPGAVLRDYHIAKAFFVFVVAYGVFLINGGEGARTVLGAAVAAVLFYYEDEIKSLTPKIIGDKPTHDSDSDTLPS